MSRVRAVVLVAVGMAGLCVALAGCGVREDAAPRPLSQAATPPALLDATPPPGEILDAGDVPAPIFLLNLEDRLVEVERPVAALRLNLVLQALALPLTAEEAADELSSGVPPETPLDVEGPDDEGVVTVDVRLESDEESFAGLEQRSALAQIVYTATAVPGVSAVTFEFNGEPTDIPDGRGETTGLPVDEADFKEFAPLPGP